MHSRLRWVGFAFAAAGAVACTQVLGMDEPCVSCAGAADYCFSEGVCVAVDSVCDDHQAWFDEFRACVCRDEPKYCLGPCGGWCGGEEVVNRSCGNCLQNEDLCPEERSRCFKPP